MPANMKTVELQAEDIPHDMICYKDVDGHTYDFGFGMNWKGVISDARTAKYVGIVKKPQISIKNGMVSITCTTPDAKIYYTTDDSTPAFVEGNEYAKPFKVANGKVVKAIAKIYGKDNSSLVEQEVK